LFPYFLVEERLSAHDPLRLSRKLAGQDLESSDLLPVPRLEASVNHSMVLENSNNHSDGKSEV
jgi:hypothetical protein